MISLGVRALHFLEHQCHDTEKHENVADEEHNDCQMCYVILGTTFLNAERLDYSLDNPKHFSEYKPSLFPIGSVIKANYSSFSLRAPPIY